MSRQATPANVLRDATIVDADVHLSGGVTADELADRMGEPYASRVRNRYCYPASSGSDWDPMLGGKIEPRTLETPEQVQSDLVEEFHVDHPLLNTISGCTRIPNTDLAVEMMRATNQVVLEKFLDPTDFRALATVAPQRPALAAEELDRLGDEEGFVGVFVESFAQDPPLGDPHYDPIYEAAEDNDLQIAFHGAAASGFQRDFPQQNSGLEEFLSVHTLAHPWQQSLTMTSLLVQGVPEKFPDLNFTFLEAGISWVTYMMWRLNKEYSFRRSEAPLLEKSPEEYVRDQFYFASQPLGEPNDPDQMRQMLDIVGTDSLMFASDYPHWDFDHPDELGKYLRQMFTEEEREQVLTENPREAFGLDL
jgi:hypothetical protein